MMPLYSIEISLLIMGLILGHMLIAFGFALGSRIRFVAGAALLLGLASYLVFLQRWDYLLVGTLICTAVFAPMLIGWRNYRRIKKTA